MLIRSFKVYISKPRDYPHSPSKLLLFLSSATGIHSTNNQLQADKYAAEGFLVVMPDQYVSVTFSMDKLCISNCAYIPRFGGDPAYSSANHNLASTEASPTVVEQVKLKAAETVKSFMLDMWLARQTPEKVMPLLQKVVEGAKEEFADAVANGGGLYAVGYCFGGKYILLLGSELPDPLAYDQTDAEKGAIEKEPVIKAGALAHGKALLRSESPVAY